MALQQFNRIKQANDIILEVAVECGLPKITDPFSSADPQYQRLITLLNLSGNSLLDTYQWARLINRFEIITVDGQTEYQLPLDWDAMIDQTLWRKGGLYPGYPGSPQVWQYFSNILAGVTITVLFREQDGLMLIYPSVGGGIPINMEYRSRGWVRQGPADTGAYRDNVANGTDYVLLDPTLVSRYLKVRFLNSMGFDTQAAMDDFNLALEARTSKDQSAPVISMARSGVGFRLIDCNNAPETGYGS